jgi:isopentenyldiphosphate isomerase
MEYLDVLDENGNLTGEKKDRNLVHRDGDWHKTIHLWIIDTKGEILLQKRSANTETCQNMWDISVAGHIPAGVSSLENCIKEAGEELGIELEKNEIKFLFRCSESTVHNNGTYVNNSFHDVFLVKKDLDLDIIELDENEVSELKFISFEKFEQMFAKKEQSLVNHEEEYSKLIELLKLKD